MRTHHVLFYSFHQKAWWSSRTRYQLIITIWPKGPFAPIRLFNYSSRRERAVRPISKLFCRRACSHSEERYRCSRWPLPWHVIFCFARSELDGDETFGLQCSFNDMIILFIPSVAIWCFECSTLPKKQSLERLFADPLKTWSWYWRLESPVTLYRNSTTEIACWVLLFDQCSSEKIQAT